MGKSNAQRQAEWRDRAKTAREFQRQHQQGQYEPPPGYKVVKTEHFERLCGIEERVIAALREKQEKHKASNAAGNLWFTPDLYLFLARMVMDGIDLDPASCATANKNVRAARHFTEADNGLDQDWTARTLWMNPPFSPHKLLAAFACKFLEEWRAGKIGQAIIVVDAAVDTGYCHALAEQADATCLVRGRISWINGETGIPMGKDGTNTPKRGQVFYYFGANVDRFADAFEIVGTISQPVRLPEAA